MDTGELLLRAVLEEPAEDTPRLIYADWLIEHGDRKRGEFIKGQVEAAARGEDCPDDVWELMGRSFRWLGIIPPDESEVGWERGFIEWLSCPVRYAWDRARLRRLFSLHPISQVCVLGSDPMPLPLPDAVWYGWSPGRWSRWGEIPGAVFSRLGGGRLAFSDGGRRHQYAIFYPGEEEAWARMHAALASFGRSLVGLPSPVHFERGPFGRWGRVVNSALIGG